MADGVPTAELVRYLDDYLESAAAPDYGPNGLQVEGPERVHRLVTGVSACRELFGRARQQGADAVLVHHGLFWRGTPYPLVGLQYRRVAELIEGGLALLAYHLPLDRHPEVGNNALAARALGLHDLRPFALHEGIAIGWRGTLLEAITAQELAVRCGLLYEQPPLLLGPGERPVRQVGIVSGGAQREFLQAIAEKLDAYITGEASEWVTNLARESGVAYLAAGHYATERLGVRALGEHLAARFGLSAEFVDVPNPV
ncbi:MAG TPA: Nif3-like dinuclear metal center hexameric protein [Thermoanaerobaculia bacterium]|jgi:dinuclear metal center YbgI/SA1388 family protein|nr:Nif3-like dinuclear metal center hexameric protein [Thermoanaerobaculia bacterium]